MPVFPSEMSTRPTPLGAGAARGPAMFANYNATLPGTAGTASENLAASPQLAQLTELLNKINLAGQTAANVARIPDAAALEEKSSANISDELAGKLPQDVLNLLAQQGAERGVATGAPGSPNANAAYLRALGLTSLGQQQTGQQNLTAAYARNPVAPLVDPSRLILTPTEAGNLAIGAGGLGLDWFKALSSGGRGGGVSGGGGYAPTRTTTGPDMSWLDALFGGGGGGGQMVVYGPGGGPGMAGYPNWTDTGTTGGGMNDWLGQFEQYPGELTGAAPAGGGAEDFYLPGEM
jgi:hypothetical protein